MKLGCMALLIAATFLAGIYYGDWAARQRPSTVYMEIKKNAVRLQDGEYVWSRAVSEDGRVVIIVWHR